jgi:hypothetical protein
MSENDRITVKLRPRAAHYRALLEANGFRPLLALIVRGRQPVEFLRAHVQRKWSVADEDDAAVRRCVAINAVEFHVDALHAPPLAAATTVAELARGAPHVDLYYSWSLKIAPTKRSASPASAPPKRRVPVTDVSPTSASSEPRAFASLFTSASTASTAVTVQQQLQPPPPPPPPPPIGSSPLRRSTRHTILPEDSRDVPLAGLVGSALALPTQEELDTIGGSSRSTFGRLFW